MVHKLEAMTDAAFSVFATNTFAGAISSALAGEYLGATVFGCFAADSTDPQERHFWQRALAVEESMVTKLEEGLAREDIPFPRRSRFHALGRFTARSFDRGSHGDYCEWVRPLIDKALNDFQDIAALCSDAKRAALVQQLIDHEIAFVDAWRELQRGFNAASVPFDAYLARYTDKAETGEE